MNIVTREEALPLTPHAFYVLSVLAKRNLSRYDLAAEIRYHHSSIFTIHPNNLYRTVAVLEKWGYVTAQDSYQPVYSTRSRSIYRITPVGQLILEWETERYLEAARNAKINLSLLAKRVTPVTL